MNVFGQNGRENLWMFFQAVIAVYLLILSVIDIRWKKVSVRSLLILLAITVLCQVLCSKGELRMMVAGGLCGGVFLFLSWFTQESFGYGDSILILILGILSGGCVSSFISGNCFNEFTKFRFLPQPMTAEKRKGTTR